MNDDLVLSQSIEVTASPAKVWRALTDPELIKEYLFGTQTITDWQEGSTIVFQGEYNGQQYQDKGVILENMPEQRLAYTYWSSFSGLPDEPENYSVIIYEVAAIDNNTTAFTWTQKGYANEETYMHSKNGMNDFLQQIKGIMER